MTPQVDTQETAPTHASELQTNNRVPALSIYREEDFALLLLQVSLQASHSSCVQTDALC